MRISAGVMSGCLSRGTGVGVRARATPRAITAQRMKTSTVISRHTRPSVGVPAVIARRFRYPSTPRTTVAIVLVITSAP